MKNLEIRTTKKNNKPSYKKEITDVIVFLRHDEDKILIRNGEQVNMDVYDNGKLIFSGDKTEFYNKLKTTTT